MLSKNETLKRLGKNIKYYRLKQGIYQKDLAAYIGINNQYLSKIENGKCNTSINTIYMISQVLCINFDDLINF